MAFPILALIPVVEKIFDRVMPDPQQAANAKLELIKLQQSGDLAQLASDTELAKGQLAINAEEAKSSNLFVSGWRPFIGWVCGAAFAYHFILQPLLAFVIVNAGGDLKLPAFEMGELSTVLMGLLGLGGLRTIEKARGVTK